MARWGKPNDSLSATIKSQWVFLHYELYLYRDQTQTQCENLPGPTHGQITGRKMQSTITVWQTHTDTHPHTVSAFLTNVSSMEPTLSEPLSSHPIKGCQIDFDNNFQLRFCINYCYKWHTYIFHSRDAITLRVNMSVGCVRIQGHGSHSI